MGNNQPNIQSSVKEQTDNKAFKAYRFVDLTGGGELIEMAKKCQSAEDYHRLDERIKQEMGLFLYNNGEGKKVHVSELVRFRTRDGPPPLAKSPAGRKGKRASANSSSSNNNNVYPMLDIVRADADPDGTCVVGGAPDGGGSGGPEVDNGYRDVCWDLEQRGAVGETCLHLCFLNATPIHMDVARRIIQFYPKIINDIYLLDVYYGEAVLHIAISNEDPVMVKFLLDHGANIHQRCFGAFFGCEDQKETRVSYLDDEYLDLKVETSYEGHVYWGEYPLSFAACCGQEQCVRLLLSRDADPNRQDTNGNTVLHILVIHQPNMNLKVAQKLFILLVNKKARLDIRNNQGLTPLTLAAKLGRLEMHNLILMLDREVRWHYSEVMCVAHPLTELDTIRQDGSINKDSSLIYIAFGSKIEHLNMLDGVVVRLLERKWETYVRRRFFRMFISFAAYFVFFLTVFLLRPGTDRNPTIRVVNVSLGNGSFSVTETPVKNKCYLLATTDWQSYLRLVCECVVVVMATGNLCFVCRDIYYQGIRIYLMMLKATPMRCLYQTSCILVVAMVPCRAACESKVEDNIAVFAILFTAPYFLFFCRGFKIVGPFVLMIYRMVMGDLLRFCTIYIIFMMGFSQAMFIVFRRVDASIFHDPGEALMGMFIMSLGEFAEIYEQFDCSAHSNMGKFLFVVYMILVTLLLVNMLIAMMGHTFEAVNETQKEWLRQWARILLVVEQTFTRQECQAHQESYSQLLQDGRRALVVRWKNQDDENNNLLGKKRRVISAEQKIVEDQELRREMETTLMRQSEQAAEQDRPTPPETAGTSTPVQC